MAARRSERERDWGRQSHGSVAGGLALFLGRGVGGGLGGGGGLLQRGLEVDALGDEATGGAGTEFYALDVLRYGELIGGGGTGAVLDAERKDGQVSNLDVLAFEQQFLDAGTHVGQHALDGSLGVGGVVGGHVGSQTVQVYGLLDDGIGVVLSEGG